jgi:hypothetical protein
MLMTPERRHSERARIPCQIPVELTDAARAAQFEADAVDLSVGGLSLRAAQLPDLGSQLFCTFEAMPGGAQILGRGEVVWRQPTGEAGGQGGEFGLRFIEVDARNQALIDEMVAERIARIVPQKINEPVLATLEIENVDEPMTARLVHAGETQALFEQQLSHFAIGKAVIAHAGPSLVRGHVASVEIRMEGTTPRLLVNLEVARDSAHFGEFMWGEPGSDTDPDVFAQTQAKADAEPAVAAKSTVQLDSEALPKALELPSDDDDEEEDADEDESDEDDLDDEEDSDEDEEEDEDEEASSTGTLAGIGAPLPAPILARKEPEAQQLPLFRRDHQQRATAPELGNLHLSEDAATSTERPSYTPDNVYADEKLAQELLGGSSPPPARPYDDEETLEEVHAVSLAASQQYAAHETEEVDGPASNGPLVRVLRVFAMVNDGVQQGSERVREWASGMRDDAGRTSGSTRGLFGPKPRRVTASTQRVVGNHKQNIRVIAIGSLCIVALVVFAYALTPSGDESFPHQDMRSDQAAEPYDPDGYTETSEASALAAAPGDSTAQDRPAGELAATADRGAPARTSAPAVAEKRPAKASPATLVAKAPPSPAAASASTAGSSMTFGSKQVPNARRFQLRMTDPVRTLLGTSKPDGFSVVIMDNKAIDKAAPIRVEHAAVEQAVILNRQGHSAELTVRFAPGKTPAYRVSGQGSMLEVLIER